jgi:Protein of unknown function (DUF2971)
VGRSDKDVLDRELAAIEQGYLWCSSFDMLNDPMEGTYATTSLVRRSPKYKFARQFFLEQKSEVGLCAFSETFNNELMWAHYADEFRGICVRYHFARLRRGLSDSHAFTRISYDDRPPKMGKPEGDLTHNFRRTLSTKYHRWQYEREWRLFSLASGRIDITRHASGRS